MLRVVVADHQELIRRGLRSLFDAAGSTELCAEAASTDEALHGIARQEPHLAIVGPLVPELDGLHAVRLLSTSFPSLRLLLLGRDHRAHAAREALQAGAHGYALATDPGNELLVAIAAVASQGTYVSPNLPRAAVASPPDSEACPPDLPAKAQRLTSREREVLGLVAAGRQTREIAELLGIGTKTVETHRRAIMRKLDLHRLADVVRFAVTHDLARAPEEAALSPTAGPSSREHSPPGPR